MQTFAEQLATLQAAGYKLAEAQAKVAHDSILYAMSKSGFKSHSTIKGGVVMCELTKTIRRTTMDLDLDFIHCPISETSIRSIVARWSRRSGLRIAIFGTIQELRQEDYRGKRVYLDITDGSIKRPLRTKVDIGVHTHHEIMQQERSFDVLAFEDDTTLLANSPEQIFTEKLLSLLRHGILSTRTKDVFDMHYLSQHLNVKRLKSMLRALILENRKSPVHTSEEIAHAISLVFQSRRFMRDMSSPKSNWLHLPPQQVADELMAFLARTLPSKAATQRS